MPAAAAARHVTNYVAAAGLAATVRTSVTKNTLNQIRNQAVAVKMRFSYKVKGVQVSVQLMIAIQKVTSNVQSVPRQSPDIY